MINFYDLEFSQLESFLAEMGQPRFRTKQVWESIYRNRLDSWQDLSTLPKALRYQLEESYTLSTLSLKDINTSADGLSTRLLFHLFDGHPLESVVLQSGNRVTACISSQSGCPVGCAFCATGDLGMNRNLSTGEMVEQVVYLDRYLSTNSQQVNNIVFMGMGEPFLNYEQTLNAVRRLNDPSGMGIGARRITLSTIGLPEKIRQFALEGLQINLAVSLHAPDDVLRIQLVPLASQIKIEEILDACQFYIEQTHRRVTFEYVMIKGVNDQPIHARELAKLISGSLCHVNLIALNPTDHYTGKSPSGTTMTEFGRILLAHKIPVSIRNSQGDEINAACGQLAGRIK